MNPIPILKTERLKLREWQPEDAEPFAFLNAHPEVMRYFPKSLNQDESNALIQKVQLHFQVHGFGFWAVEHQAKKKFIGMIGLNVPSFTAPFTPCVEIGWRLNADYWNQGLATEGAWACLDFAFHTLFFKEIVSFTYTGNTPSRRVMEKIGMKSNSLEDFDYPLLPEGHPLRPHVLYRIQNKS